MREEILISNPVQERSSFDVRFARCAKLLAFTASRVLGGNEGVELVVRNCRVTAALDLSHFEHEGAFRSWLLRVLINEALVVLRAKHAERQPMNAVVRRKCRSISNQATLRRREKMKLFFASNKRKLVCLAALVCMIAVSSVSALAATSQSAVSRSVGDNHSGMCCTVWDSSVRVFEPSALAPIVVTWSTDYQSTAPFSVGLKLNNGPCVFAGPSNVPTFVSPDGLTYGSHTAQWLIVPGDYKLVRGWNTISLCGGGFYSDTDTLFLGMNTLAARVGN